MSKMLAMTWLALSPLPKDPCTQPPRVVLSTRQAWARRGLGPQSRRRVEPSEPASAVDGLPRAVAPAGVAQRLASGSR